MKQKSIFLFIISLFITLGIQAQEVQFSMISQTSTDVTIRVDFPGYYETIPVEVNGEVMYKLAMENAYPVDETGAPEILKSATSVIIPEGSIPTITILESPFTLIPNFNLAPSKGTLYRNIDPNTVPYLKGSQYLSNFFWGDQPASIGEPYQMRDFHGVAITVHPFSYQPVEKSLKVYQYMIIKISYQPAATAVNAKKNNVVYDQIYSRHFLNYDKFNNSKYSPLTEEGEMLIIAPATFVSALEPLRQWKIKSGIQTTIVPTSTAGSTAAAIKTYITNYYNAHNLAYVLIVGDHTQFPYFTLSGNTSDNYFTEVAGGDNYPDFLLGKLSAENVEQVTVQVNKFIGYDQGLFTQTHHSAFCGIGSSQGPGDNNEYDYQHIRTINNLLQTYTYTSGYEFFDGSQGGLDASGNPTATMVLNAINQGVGVINYCGHGDYNLFVTSNFTNTYVSQLTNYEKLPFIFSVACQNGNYVNKLCFAEVWLRAVSGGKPTGAVGALMATINQPWNPPMCGQDECIKVLTESNPGFTKRTLGGISFGGLMKMLDTYSDVETYRTWLLFGDPSMMVRTTIGTPITATHLNQVAVNAANVTISSPIDGARVTLSSHGVIVGQGTISNGTTNITLPSTLVDGDTVYVVLTKFNHIPYQGYFVMTTLNEPFLIYTTHQFRNQQGTSNQPAETGKNFKISFSLQNVGTQNSTNVICKLRTSDPYITIIDSVEQMATIAVGATQNFANGFQVKFANNVPFGHTSNFTIIVTDDNTTRIYDFDEHVLAPKPSSGNITVNDQAAGNNNNRLDYGEIAAIQIPMENIGDGAAIAGSVKIESVRGYINFSNPTIPVSNLLAAANTPVNFIASVKYSVNTPRVDLLKITYTTGAYTHVRTYEIGIAGAQTSGVEETNNSDLSVYPNPTTGIFHFTLPESSSLENITYKIYDVYGKLLESSTVTTNTTTVDLTNYASGVYMIQILDQNTTLSQQKIIRK